MLRPREQLRSSGEQPSSRETSVRLTNGEQRRATGSARFGDIGFKAVVTIDVISSWAVNTFYNHLHERAVTVHAAGRTDSITDAYKLTVRWYLDSFKARDGFGRILRGLYKYYSDYSKFSSLPFDMWTKEVLAQFVPSDYMSIMSNVQQDATLRSILVQSIARFSSDIVCTKLIDLLIMNHGDPSVVPTMKGRMKDALMFERHRIFEAIFKSSVGINKSATDEPMEAMKRELRTLVEKNVILEHKVATLTTAARQAIAVAKARDDTIIKLTGQLERMRAVPAILPPPTPAASFVASVERSTGLKPQNLGVGRVPATDVVPTPAPTRAPTPAPHLVLPPPVGMAKLAPPLTHTEKLPDAESLPTPPEAADNDDPDTEEDDDNEPASEPAPTMAQTIALDMNEFLSS